MGNATREPTPGKIAAPGRGPGAPGPVPPPGAHGDDQMNAEDRLDEQERESFPASDPHADWAGPPG